jgi:type IV pilus biogenesis protein CpaD/CtpE
MSSSTRLLLAAATFALAGCNTANTHIGDEDPGMGEAVRYNAALQTINPTPVYPPTAAQPGDNGDKGAHAVKRYRTDQVKEVETMRTSTGGSGGAGMSNSGTPH